MDKSLILNKIQEHIKIRSNKDFAAFLGIKPTTLSMWKTRNTYDVELLFKKCEWASPEWLLTGRGSMLRSGEPLPVAVGAAVPDCAERLKDKEAVIQAKEAVIQDKERFITELLADKERLIQDIIELRKRPVYKEASLEDTKKRKRAS